MSTPLMQRGRDERRWLRPDLFYDLPPSRERRRGRPAAMRPAAPERFARAMGWFSIGLGLTEVAAPRALTRWLGVDEHRTLVRVLGAREIMSGVGLLSQRIPAGWMWSRVAGDVMDLALLSLTLGSSNGKRSHVTKAIAAVGAVTAVDLMLSRRLSRGQRMAGTPVSSPRVIPVEKSIAINRPPEECYRFWRELENLPRFMTHLESVRQIDARRSRWVARGPAGKHVEWEAEIIEDRPNECIAWRSLEGADVDNSGWVGFERAPGNRGTIVRVKMQYRPPAGALGALVARAFGEEPNWQVQEDLRRFKRILETGEVPTTVGQPSGRRSRFAQALHLGSRA